MVKKLLLDRDPGLDDALAILLAHGDPVLELVGITAGETVVNFRSASPNAIVPVSIDVTGFRGHVHESCSLVHV